MNANAASDGLAPQAATAIRRVRPHLLFLAVAGAVFLLAVNDGSYGVEARGSLAIAVWWALVLGVGLALLPVSGLPRAALVTGGLAVALAALTLLSIAWAPSAERAFNEFNRVALYVGIFAGVVLVSREGSAASWANGLALGIVAVGMLALASRLFPHLLGSGQVPHYLPGVKTRLSYPLEYWNGQAIFIALALPLLLRAAVAERLSVTRALALGIVPALAAAIYLSASRGGAAAAVIGCVLFAALAGRPIMSLAAIVVASAGSALALAVLAARPELVDGPLGSGAAVAQGRTAALLIALICCATGLGWALLRRVLPLDIRVARSLKFAAVTVAVLGVCAAAVAADPAERFRTFKRPPAEAALQQEGFTEAHFSSANGSGRWQLWVSAVDEFETRPILGRGAGSYESWWSQHASVAQFVRNAHSLYLETAGELGIVGLALVLAMFASALVTAARRMRDRAGDRAALAALVAVVAAFATGAAVDWVWQLTVVAVVAVTCLALLTGPATLPPIPQQSKHPRTKSRRRRLAVASFVAVGLLAIACEAVPVLTQEKLRHSQEAVRQGDTKKALEDARAARKLQPWAASPYLQLALVEEQSGDLGSARASIHRAIDRGRLDWRLWLVAARVDTKLGRIEAALADLERARTLNRKSPLFASR